jgi:type I restriction enzyme, R subunit
MNTMQANFDEAKQSQLTMVELLVNMGYEYISREDCLKQRKGLRSNFLLHDIAINKLQEINSYEEAGQTYKFSEQNVRQAVEELENLPFEGLLQTSKDVYNSLMTLGGKTIKEFVNGKGKFYNFRFIDFDHPENNVFHVTVEFEAEGRSNIRPDIILFVNGIPFVVIENKKSGTDVKEAMQQMTRNQGVEFCPKLYVYPQLLIATNSKEFRYGTTGTPWKFYVNWKEKEISEEEIDAKVQALIKASVPTEFYEQILKDLNGATFAHKQRLDRLTTEQDRGVICMLNPKRLLHLTKHFIIYDAGVKKVARYQQFFAIQKILNRVKEKEESVTGERRHGGVVWHTQGSGKSLTMVMFVKALIEDPDIQNPRVLIVTDRIDLDKQIKETFEACKLKKEVIRAKTGKDLLDMIKVKDDRVITTLVQKFESAARLRSDFSDPSENIFVLIDEAHRTQGGIANAEMNRTIPNACTIAFTGTPLMKKEQSTAKKFGGYIDKYTIDDALADGVILPLIYEGRYADLEQDQEKIDRHIERITKDMSDEQRKSFQKHISTRLIKNNPQRIAEIALDIENHFVQYFQGTGLKAQLVAPSKYSAILFHKLFEETGRVQSAVVISESQIEEDETDDHKKEVARFMEELSHKWSSAKRYESEVIQSFKRSDDGVELLIVVDKLLTGFDAPRNTVLYLSKDLKDHNLLQAIARVNRLYDNPGDPKTSGFIIDYSENAKNLDYAMKLFGSFEDEDVKSTLFDTKEKIHELEQSYSDVTDQFKALKGSKDDEAYLQFLKEDPEREIFYRNMSDFIKHFNECLSLRDFVHHFDELDTYKMELKKYLELRKSARLQYGDREDFTEQKEALVRILDKYIDAHKVEALTKPINITDRAAFEEAIEDLQSDKSRAEAIASQTQRTIQENMEKDPEYYKRFSEKVGEILQKMRAGKMADIEALSQLRLITEDMLDKKDPGVPESITTRKGADIFYRNMLPEISDLSLTEEQVIKLILDMMEILHQETIVDWHKNSEVKRIINNRIDDYFYDIVKVEMDAPLTNERIRELVDIVMNLCIHNHELF